MPGYGFADPVNTDHYSKHSTRRKRRNKNWQPGKGQQRRKNQVGGQTFKKNHEATYDGKDAPWHHGIRKGYTLKVRR